jgi:uncharacterized delta-60 repeat protein
MRPRFSIAIFAVLALGFAARPSHAAPGDLDAGFNGGVPAVLDLNPAQAAEAIAAAANPLNGDILWAGVIVNGGGVSGSVVAYKPDGTFDTSVGLGNGIITLSADRAGYSGDDLLFFALAVDAQGRILATGQVTAGSGTGVMVLVRFLPDGTLDDGFGAAGTGIVTDALNSFAYGSGLSLTADGHILVTGAAADAGGGETPLTVWRFNPDGTADTDFADDGHVQIAAIDVDGLAFCFPSLQPDGALIAACQETGSGGPWMMTRLNADGAVDDAFGSSGFVTGAANRVLAGLALASDGGFAVSELDTSNSPPPIHLRRFLADGTVDPDFNGGSPDLVGALAGPVPFFAPVAVQPDGAILAGGHLSSFGGHNLEIRRFLTDGTLDTGFGNTFPGTSTIDFGNIGGSTYTPGATALVLQGDGKILATGYADSSVGSNEAAFLTRVDSDDFVFTPDAFSFMDQTGVARGVTVTSNAITVSGLTDGVPVPVRVSGGEYEIGSGGWTSAPGYAVNGDQIAVRHTSSSSYDTQTTTTLSVGGYAVPNNLSVVLGSPVTADFSSTTEAAPPPAGGGGGGGGGGLSVFALLGLLLLAYASQRSGRRKRPDFDRPEKDISG